MGPTKEPLLRSASGAPRRAGVWAAAGLLAGAGLVAYANSLRVPFIFDDPIYILDNPPIERFWPPWEIVPMRPVLGLTLALNWRLGGTEVFSYHALNLLIHILAGITLFGLARRTLAGERLGERFGAHATPLALGISLLWLVHPLQTESVTYVIQRGESLMGLFYLLTLYCAARAHGSPRRAWWWTLAALACLLGLGAKQVMATAPLMVGLYYWVFFPHSLQGRWRYALFASLAVLWCGGCVALAVASGHASAGFADAPVSPWAYAWTQSGVILHYLRLALWPAGLCLDYGWPVAQSVRQTWPSVVVLGVLLALTAWGVAGRRPVGFLGIFFLLVLAPTSSFMPIADVAAEHRVYLPLAAVAALVVLAAYRVWVRVGAKAQFRREALVWRAAGWVALGLGASVLALLTIRRNRDYRSEVAIWEDTVEKRPRNHRARTNLGVALGKLGRNNEALEQLREALRLQPDYAQAANNLGNALAMLGQRQDALVYYRRAIRCKPRYAEAYNNLGATLADLQRYGEAAECYRKAVDFRPRYPEALNNLGEALTQLGRPGEALPHFEEALRLRPGYANAHCNFADALARLGRLAEAAEHYREALRLRPSDDLARQRLEALSKHEREP